MAPISAQIHLRHLVRRLVAALILVVAATGAVTSTAHAETAGSSTPNAAADSLDAGGFFSCAVLTDGRVKCWGDNSVGQLGLGDTQTRGDSLAEMGTNLPAVPLGTGRTALTVSAGFNFACAILDDHSVKCWGSGSSGVLGSGNTGDRGDNGGEMGDAMPKVNLGTGRTALALSAGNNLRRAPSSTTTRSSAGATAQTGCSGRATPVTAATTEARWAMSCPSSTSEPAAPHSP